MRLESVVLQGFKSFAEKTVVKVLPGITAIVGPNGCGKCLTGDTQVVLADGRLVPIGALVEEALSQGRPVRCLDDGIVAAGANSGTEVLSLDPSTLRLEPKPVEAFIRRAAPSFLLRVRTRSGREVVSTHYHPFFTLKAGNLKVLTAEELVEGVRIGVPRCLPVKPRPLQTLVDEVVRSFTPADRVYVPHSPALDPWLDAAVRLIGGWERLAREAGVDIRHLRRARAGGPLKVAAVGAIEARVGLPPPPIEELRSARSAIRLPQDLDAGLACFLGYLIAEGRNTASDQVWFVTGDQAVTSEFCRLATELFGLVPRRLAYTATVTDTLLFSRALCLLLDRVFGVKVGGGSATKVVPPQVWSAPDAVVAAFLSGLFEGDAYVHGPTAPSGKVMPYLEYATASRRLAEGVVTLLLRLGIFALLRPKTKCASNTRARHRRTYYSVYVCGVDQLRRLSACVRFVGAKQSRLDAILRQEVEGNPNLDLVPNVGSLVRAAVAAGGMPVKPLRALSPKLAAYVEGRCEASRAGLGEAAGLIERHGRTAEGARHLVRQMRTLADSDVYWDEVVAVERIDPPAPWVYDLTVAETHNFVAANVIVHNSNISEAVRWALGEQSAKALRGNRMEDLIFHGSASRKPIGLAEVDLTFSNDGALAVPWSEVVVGRRLYCTGESEYVLNGNVCRLRDILDLLAGTGASPRAYSVMDQEKLNHVLTAKPYERRIFIEEAAGIARYKQQRQETRGKLEAARQNLQRVRDVMDEVRRQLGSLERQARRAQQYKALSAEKQSLALAVVAADYDSLASEGARLAAELARLVDRRSELQVRLAGLGARESSQRALIEDTAHRLGDRRQAVHKVQGEVERLLERREQMGVQLHELDEEDVRLGEELRLTEERIAGLHREREAKSSALAEARGVAEDRDGAAVSLQAALDALRAGLAAERDRLEALRLEQVRVAGERSDLTRSAGELRERQAQLERRAERLERELEEARAEAAGLAARRAAVASEHEQAVVALHVLQEECAEVEAALAAREPRLAEARAGLGDARVALAARRSSLEALEALERAREGYGAGVRAMFEAGRPRLKGVLGTVADLLEVPAGLDTAVEAVLGERLEWVVVERFQHARAAVALLDSERAGSATFVPLETLPPVAPPLGDEPGVQWAARAVGAPSGELLHYLLGRVAIVDHLDDAERLWRRNGIVATYVTPGGEVLSPVGRLRGGSAGDPEPGTTRSPLGRKRAVRELGDEVDRLLREVDAAETAVAGLERDVAALRLRLPGLRQAMQASDAARLAGAKDAEQASREHERVARHVQTLEAELALVTAQREETEATSAGLLRRIEAAQEAERAQAGATSTLREMIEGGQAREAAAGAELTACRVEIAATRERLEALQRELHHLDELGHELADRVEQGRLRRQQLGERRAFLAEERERADGAAREVAADRDRLETEERVLAERHEALVAELREIESEARGVQGDNGRLESAAHAVEISAAEGRVRREELLDEARRTFSVSTAEELLAHYDPGHDLAATRQRLAELVDKLGAMGAVNLVADEEYREAAERLGFLRTQHDDLVASIKDLEKALRGVTRTAQERFQRAFDEINQQFGQIFERLFEGGRAELRLVEPEEGEDPLEAGVELMAQPRGKRLQAVTLMSGGEKALTGLALLFAIFFNRPSPFCVLDEADAPLDDANIHRFLRVLRELTSQTQFLVITHNRKTMEAADILYGVTMEEPGLSKLVSVSFAP